MNIIECKRVKFFSPDDESAFFEWVEKIKSVNVKGQKDSLLLTVDKQRFTDSDLHNLTALFRRYKISIKHLEIIINDENRESFEYYKYGYSINVYPASLDESV